MENQDKIYRQIQQALKNAEAQPVPELDKIWARVEEKLDKKEEKKPIFWLKKWAVAASLLFTMTLGYHIFSEKEVTLPTKNPVVETPNGVEKIITIENANSALKTEEKIAPKRSFDSKSTDKILKKEQENEAVATQNNSDVAKKEVIEEPAALVTKEIAVSPLILEENNMETTTSVVQTEVVTNPISGEKTIQGVVTEKSNGLPLPGVSIVIKGTRNGVQTDVDGKFSIKAKPGDQLVFSYVGFNERIVTISKKENIVVALEEESSNLSEVVVVAEGYHRRNRVKNKTETTTNKKLQQKLTVGIDYVNRNNSNSDKNVAVENKANVSILQSLQGQSPGLSLISSNGTPGSAKFHSIRGISTIQKSNEPLYIIDGVLVSQNLLKKIDPNDIKDITVLKDTSATSIYGNRGRNGVIVLTTKDGKFKKLSKKEWKKLQDEIEIKSQIHQNELFSNEDYDSFEENAFESPVTKPLSTFSIDVDHASYTNVRRFINNGQKVPKDAVRVEEMINFFKYNNPTPTNNDPFAITTEYAVAPWNFKHKLLRISLQGKVIPTDKLPASNLVFLIDVSGSMNEQNKLPLLKESMKILVKELRKEDKVSIIVYAGAAGMVLPPTSGNEKQNIIDALDKLSAGGSTAGGAGIELAYKTAEENFIKNGNNRVILATDGDFNVGNSSNTDMQTLIEEKRKSGVFLTCLGYGMGNYKDSKMEILSDKGNGNYAYIDNIQEANRFLGKEFKGSMFAIAKDVKIQIEFNPKHAKSYRLIGYENRKLRDEDFTNDAIDAGELGSGHTVTALYEIIPIGVESEFYKEEIALKYSQSSASTSTFTDELATIKFRYKKPDSDKSIEMVQVIENKTVSQNETSSDFKFSSAVAWFGLTLKDSKLIPNKDLEAIKSLAKKGLANDDEGYKAEFIRLVESAK